jgi:uncharacterized damage-inducible protein DinB
MRLFIIPFFCAAALAGAISPAFEPETGQDPATDAARAAFPVHQRNIVASFAAMPPEKYGFRPTPELMTFGELAVHIASANVYYCRILTPSRPRPGALPKPDAAKEDLVKALQTSFDYCGVAVTDARDAALAEAVTLPSGKSTTRATVLLDLLSGMDHHYGQAAGYLRLNGVLPPTASNELKK